MFLHISNLFHAIAFLLYFFFLSVFARDRRAKGDALGLNVNTAFRCSALCRYFNWVLIDRRTLWIQPLSGLDLEIHLWISGALYCQSGFDVVDATARQKFPTVVIKRLR